MMRVHKVIAESWFVPGIERIDQLKIFEAEVAKGRAAGEDTEANTGRRL